MSYAVKEMFYTLQGEGMNAGRPAVFCRFAGCNLWSGRRGDAGSADCARWCDTDFIGTGGSGGGRFETAEKLAQAVRGLWPEGQGARPFMVFTGGEPALQLDAAAIEAVHARGFEIAVETNGTRPLPDRIDWICVSPKAGSTVVVRSGDELKVVYPHGGIDPTQFTSWDFRHFILQPLDGPDRERSAQEAVRFCLEHPRWRLGLQTHKALGLR